MTTLVTMIGIQVATFIAAGIALALWNRRATKKARKTSGQGDLCVSVTYHGETTRLSLSGPDDEFGLMVEMNGDQAWQLAAMLASNPDQNGKTMNRGEDL